MSGFEIAGLTLGAFKLLCEAGKQVGQTSKHFKTWWRFEREFEKFLWAVEREQIAFSQTLEIFLAPLEDISVHEREVLQSGLHSHLWHIPHIQKALRQGVQEDYYEWLIRQLVDINDALTQLHKLLPIVESSPDDKMLDSHVYRLRHSFFPRKDELLKLITEKNESIYLFFSRASLVSSRPPRADKKKVNSCLEFQRQALILHETLRTCWSCSCAGTDQHPMAITTWKLARHSSLDAHHIKILSTAGPVQLRVEVEVNPKSKKALPRASGSKQTEITTLRQELTLRTKLKELKENSSKGISLIATSTISLAGRPGLGVIPKEDKPKSGSLSSFRQRLRRRTESGSDPPESQLSLNSTPQSKYQLPPLPQVQFADEPPPNSVAATGATVTKLVIPEITNFCQTLKDPSLGETCRGFLQMKEDILSQEPNRVVFHLDPADQSELHDYRVEDLETYIRTTPRRDARIRLGLSIVLNTLNLGKTPLVPTLWHKDDVFVYRHSADSSISQPYLKSSHLTSNVIPDTTQARQRLFTLGILLLELLFSSTLVDKLGPPDFTNTELLCRALTWQRRAEEEFGDGIAEAIRKCIVCAFEPAADLGSAAFVLAVWANVVQPLEEFLRAWGGVGIAVG